MSIYQVKMREWFTGLSAQDGEIVKFVIKQCKPRCEQCGRKRISFEIDYCLHSGPYSGFFEFTCHRCFERGYGKGDPRKYRRTKRKECK